jgi:hypothetical protein
MYYYIRPAENYASQRKLAKEIIKYVNDTYGECVAWRDALEGEIVKDIQAQAQRLAEASPRSKPVMVELHGCKWDEDLRLTVEHFSIICKHVKKVFE